MLQPFVLEEPTSVREASALLARYGEVARLYAGGIELLLVINDPGLKVGACKQRYASVPTIVVTSFLDY